MKNFIYLFLSCVAAFCFGCKKKSDQPAQPVPKVSKICNNSFVAWKILPGDSLVLVEVDSSGKSSAGPYPHVKKASMCYNRNDQCIYSMQGDSNSGKLYLYRFNIKSKKTDIMSSTNAPNIKNTRASWTLKYNNTSNKFYFSYFIDAWLLNHSYHWGVNEVSVVDTTFTLLELNAPSDLRAKPMLLTAIDEQNGDIYLDQARVKYSLATNTVKELQVGLTLDEMQFNPNDGMFYGISYSDSITFSKFDPNTGTKSFISALSPSFISGDISATLDPCNNQYIIQSASPNVNITFIDITDGSVSRKISVPETYTGLMYIPQ